MTILAPLVPSTKTNKITSHLGDFLNSQGQKCHTVNGDGNCMFRAIAHQAFGLQDRHVELRSVLHGIIHANTGLYRCLWIGNGAFAEHVDNIKLGGVWGTQVELGVPVLPGEHTVGTCLSPAPSRFLRQMISLVYLFTHTQRNPRTEQQ